LAHLTICVVSMQIESRVFFSRLREADISLSSSPFFFPSVLFLIRCLIFFLFSDQNSNLVFSHFWFFLITSNKYNDSIQNLFVRAIKFNYYSLTTRSHSKSFFVIVLWSVSTQWYLIFYVNTKYILDLINGNINTISRFSSL
jgi:hypothetical protein